MAPWGERALVRTYFIETWGCQMNTLDSQHLAGILEDRGLERVDQPGEADLALLNTCSVREKAVQKVLSRLGELRRLREDGGRPRLVGLCGCVAEQEGSRLLARSPVLSFVLGPGRVGQLGTALDEVAAGERPELTGFAATRDLDTHLVARGSSARQYVTVIHGCDQHCTFCVVPYTRGREVSRPLADIVAEVTELAERGVKEITLLGQTVNAYRCPATGADLSELLARVTAVDALWRIQFITSHPRYFDARLVDAMATLPRLSSYLHLPFQSGSDSVLRRMHRRYTRAEYVDLVASIRAARPGVTLSTDVIVGFPGETAEEFEDTVSLVEEIGFGQLYGFAYSPRPRTPAARYPGAVPRAVAGERLQRLFDVQGRIQLALNQERIGRRVEVLVDGPAKRGSGLWQGRGDDNRVVNFPSWEGIETGVLVRIEVTGATTHALLGERVTGPSGVLPSA